MIFFWLYFLTFLVAFFPAYFGYQSQFSWLSYAFTILFALTTFVPLIRYYKLKWLLALCLVWLFGYAIESIWVLTCYPYGCFQYSDQLGPKIFNIVPYLLFFTWPPLVFSCRSWAKRCGAGIWSIWVIGWLLLVGVDLLLDPIAVLMWLWSFKWWGIWFWVPLQNFIWWYISGTLWVLISEKIIWKQFVNWLVLDRGLWFTISFFLWYLLRVVILSYV